MARLLPLLSHLAPPYSCARIRLDRFSPFHAAAAKYGFHRMRPARAYYYVFPLGRNELARLAYFFDFDYQDARDPDSYIRPVQEQVGRWWAARLAAAGPPRLDAWFGDGRVVIEDTRPMACAPRFELDGLDAALYSACDIAASPATLARRLNSSEDRVRTALDALHAKGLVAEDGGRYLSLAVFRVRIDKSFPGQAVADVPAPTTAVAEPLFGVV